MLNKEYKKKKRIYIYIYIYIYIHIKYIHFNFGRGFCGSFSMLFPKAPTSCGKKNFGIIFAALYFLLYEFKKCVSDF